MNSTDTRRPPPLLVRAAALVLATWLVLGACAGEARAQGETPPQPPSEESAQVVAIGIEEIPERAESVQRELLTLFPDAETRHAVETIDKQIAEYAKAVQKPLQESREAFAADPSVARLRELDTQLQGGVKPFDEWAAHLDASIAQVSQAIQRTELLAETWAKTLDAARAGGASDETLSRVGATQREIAEAKDRLLRSRNAILTVRQRLVDARVEIDRHRQEIQVAMRDRLSDVFELEDLALWEPELWRRLSAELSGNALEPIGETLRASRRYLHERRQVIALQLVLLLILAVSLRVLAIRVRAKAGEDLDVAASRVFELPISMALTIVLAATRLFHPLAPRFFLVLTWVIALIPTVLILRRVGPAAMRPMLVAMIFFSAVDIAVVLVGGLPTLARLALVAELAAAAAFLLWLRRPQRLVQLTPEARADPVLHFVDLGQRAAMVLIGLGIAANAVGAVDLGVLLGEGTLNSAYLGLFTYVFYRVLWSLSVFALRARPLRFLNLVTRNRDLLLRKLDPLLRLTAALLWLTLALLIFNVADIVYGWLATTLTAQLDVGALGLSLGDLLAFGFTMWLTFRLARFVSFALDEDVFPRVAFGAGVPYALSSLVHYALLFIGFFIAMAAAGLELSKLSVIVGGLGVGIGFGLQNVVNNFVSGLILLFERPLKLGDSVQIPQQEIAGTIRRIGIRASTIRTADGADVIVPNGALISGAVVNWTLMNRHRRIDLRIGVEYGADPRTVIEILEALARSHARILAQPAPRAFLARFGESALEFRLDAWLGDVDDDAAVRSDLGIEVQSALRAAGIQIPFPGERHLHLRSISPQAAEDLGSTHSQRSRPERRIESEHLDV